MTGPEHYREAERLIAQAGQEHGAGWNDNAVFLNGQAQAHALLALAAATALNDAECGKPGPDHGEWCELVGTQPAHRRARNDIYGTTPDGSDAA
jgi:hypothetical protein